MGSSGTIEERVYSENLTSQTIGGPGGHVQLQMPLPPKTVCGPTAPKKNTEY